MYMQFELSKIAANILGVKDMLINV